MTETPKSAYRIVTERLVIRCWEPADAVLAKEAIDSSLDHLRPWMPWAHAEPTTLEQKVQLLRLFRGKFDLDQDAVYGIFDREERRVVGGTGLHPRVGDDASEIGYWIRADATGKGFATESTAAVTRVAFEILGFDRIEIRCDPANVRSAAIPKRLGYEYEATLRGRLRNEHDEPRDAMVFTMFAEDYPASPCAAAKLEAFDAAGARIVHRVSHTSPR
jgi:RimJ/RimL family protein N-acetyltransferase